VGVRDSRAVVISTGLFVGGAKGYNIPMEPIQILFKEYDTLRGEIVSRTNNGYQLIALGAGALAWLASRPVNGMLFVSIGIILLGMLVFVALWWRDTYMCSCRVKELEGEINALAGQTLLKWETHWTGGPIAFISRYPGMARINNTK